MFISRGDKLFTEGSCLQTFEIKLRKHWFSQYLSYPKQQFMGKLHLNQTIILFFYYIYLGLGY